MKAAKQQHISEKVNLSDAYPISLRFIFRMAFPYLAALLALVVIWLVKDVAWNPTRSFVTDLSIFKFRIWFSVAGAIVIIRLTYAWLYRGTFYYAIERKSLVIAKGVIIRNRGNLPFSQITDLFVKRGLLEFLFGLSSVVVSSASDYSEEFASIEGLSWKTAEELQLYLRKMLEDYQITRQDFGNIRKHEA